MKPSDIKELQSLHVSAKIPDDYYPYLKKIAEVKPGVSLLFGENVECKSVLKIFKPAFLGYHGSFNDPELLSSLSNVELLIYNLNDTSEVYSIPALPKLRQLILACDKTTAYKDLLKNNRQIEKLTIVGEFEKDFFQPLEKLKQLCIVPERNKEKAPSLSFLKGLKQLEVLNLNGAFSETKFINDLPKLRWLSLMIETNHKELDSVVESHKNLEVLELKSDSALNLQPVLKLKKLYGLVLVGQESIDTTLYSMKNLKYLSLPSKVFKNEANIANLQKSLPACIIVPNDGFCLGSGWLLLLLPFILIFRFFMREKEML